MVKKINKSGGFTIVEILIAAVILIIATVATVSVARKGIAMEVEDHHRRSARTIIMRIFENEFDYRGYPDNYGDFSILEGKNSFDTTYEVTVDKRSFRAEPLMGEMRLDVARKVNAIEGVDVSIDSVTATIVWTEIDKTADTLTLTKILAATE